MKKLITLLAFMTVFMGAKAAEATIYTKDYSTATSFDFWKGDFSNASVSVTDGLLVITNTAVQAETYTLQLHIGEGITTQEGNKYIVKIDYKAAIESVEGSNSIAWVALGDWGKSQTNYWVPLTQSDDFQTLTLEFNGDGDGFKYSGSTNFVMWQSGKIVGTIYIKKVEVIEISPDPDPVWTDIIVNGDMEGESAECFYSKEQGVGGPYLAPILEGVGKDGSKGVKVESYNDPSDDWDTQFFIRLPYQLPAGTKYKVSFDYKATKEGAFQTQAHAEPTDYIDWHGIGEGTFTTQWKTFEGRGTISSDQSTDQKKMQTIAFNLGLNKVATKFYFDNIKFEIDEEVANTLTPNPKENPATYPDPITSMAVVGTFPGCSWDFTNAWAMTQSADDEAEWTFSKVVDVEAMTYEYKVAANSSWSRYVLPSGDNATLEFGTEDRPAGKYNLTFTANVKKHTLTLDAEEIFTLTVAGDNTTLFGTAWAPTETANDLTKQEDGTYSITFENKALEGDVKYKIVKNHSWDDKAWPSQDRVISISMPGTYDITINFDYATKAVSEVMAVYKGISDAGYATYCSPYDLNFVGTGVQAYIAKVEEGNVVNFYEVYNAQAGTGLLLKAAEGSYKLKMESITGEDATDATGNALEGVLTNTEVPAGSFVLMAGTPNNQGTGFYKTKNVFTVGANTAYIKALPNEARTFIGFGDNTTTAIEGVATVKENNGEIYNLQGQRVVKAQKGLYIVNGKKVLVK